MRRQVARLDERHALRTGADRAAASARAPRPPAARGPPPMIDAGALARRSPARISVIAAVGDAEADGDRGRRAVVAEHVDAAGQCRICGMRAPARLGGERLEPRAPLRIERRRDPLLDVAPGLRASRRAAPRRRGRRRGRERRTAPRRRRARSPPPARASAARRRRCRSRSPSNAPPAARPAGRLVGGRRPGRRRRCGAARRTEAQGGVRHAQDVAALVGDDLQVGGHAGQQGHVAVLDADHRRVGDDVLDRLRAEPDHAHGAGEGAVRIGVDREGHASGLP